ncbi:MAG: hypothetical protein HY703_12120 [Gemmatimonadetes bacterium]|nr:hypothetical protein [Gemmatimonadota bacterium]
MATRIAALLRPAARAGRPPEHGARPGRFRLSSRSVLGLLVGSHLALALLVFEPAPHTGGDNAAYVTLARSLVEQRAYLDLYDPATPAHTQYPPVFPGILALALLAGLDTWIWLKLVIVGFSAAAIAFSYLWLRRRRRPGLALAVAAVLALSPGVLHLSHWVLSDVPFWTFTALALWAFERLPPGQRGRLWLAIAAIILAYFTRSAGLPLVLAAAAWLALRRRWRDLGLLAAVFLPLALAWWLRARAHGGVIYAEQFWAVNPYRPDLGRMGPLDLLNRVVQNDRHYMTEHLPILVFGLEGSFFFPVSATLAVFAIFGWVGRLGRRLGVAELFLPLYVGLLFVWPEVWSGERLLLPALPLVLAYAGEAFIRLARRRLSRRGARWAGAAATLGIILTGVPALHASARQGLECTRLHRAGLPYACLPSDWQDFFAMAEWSRDRLPAGAVVVSRKPRLFYALSGHRGRLYPMSREAADFFALAREIGARYVVLDRVDQLSDLYLVPVLVARPDGFCAMHSLGMERTTLLGIRPLEPGAAQASSQTGEQILSFTRCPAEYWRRPR